MSKIFKSSPIVNKSTNFFAEKASFEFPNLEAEVGVLSIVFQTSEVVGLITNISVENLQALNSISLDFYNDVSLSTNSLFHTIDSFKESDANSQSFSFSATANAIFIAYELNENELQIEPFSLKVELLQFNGELSSQTILAKKVNLENLELFQKNLDSGDSNLQLAIEKLANYDSLSPTSITLTQASYSIDQRNSKLLYINPNNDNRTIYLNEDWTGLIINNSDGAYSLELHDGIEVIESMNSTTNLKALLVFYDNEANEYVLKQTANFTIATEQAPINANNILLNTSNFDKNLSATDINLQTALETLDEALSNTNSALLNFTSEATQSLITNLTLEPTSSYFQIIKPVDSDRIINLNTGWIGQIINDGDGTYSLLLQSPTTNSIIAELSPATNIKSALVWYDNTLAQFIIQQTSTWQTTTGNEPSQTQSSLTQTQKTLLKLALRRGF